MQKKAHTPISGTANIKWFRNKPDIYAIENNMPAATKHTTEK